MAIKTFSAGEVLTASDTNTYLANSGLVYVTSATVGTGVSSVTVSSCFSSTYDNYRIVLSNLSASAIAATRLQLSNSTGSTYATAGWIFPYGSSLIQETSTAQVYALIGHCNSSGKFSTLVELESPYLSQPTTFIGQSISVGYGDDRRSYDSSTNSSTGFTFSPASGTLTGGTITVYGYRKA